MTKTSKIFYSFLIIVVVAVLGLYLWENLREHNSYERFATKREVLKNIYAQPSQELVDYQTFTIQQPAFSGNLFQLDDFEPNTLVELTFKNATTINILSSMYNVNDDKVIPLFSLGYPVGNSFSENGENIVVLLSNTNQLSLHNIAVSTPNSYVLTLPSNDNNLSLIQQGYSTYLFVISAIPEDSSQKVTFTSRKVSIADVFTTI